MSSETWVGNESRCAQCAGSECNCECDGCGEVRDEGSKQGQQCQCRACEHSAEAGAANCKQCMQLRLLKGGLVKACGCCCDGCSEQGNEQPEHLAAGEAEVCANQANSTMGESQHQQSQVSETASSSWSQVSESGDSALERSEMMEEGTALEQTEVIQNSAGTVYQPKVH